MGIARKCTGAACMIALAALAAAATPAAALEPGVHVDPGSPAAKQYALPLTQAREAGSSGSSSGTEAGLFGAGIKPPTGGGRAGANTGAGRRSTATAGASHGSAAALAARGTSAPSSARDIRAATTIDAGRGDATLALIGGGVVVIVLGALGGTVLRHSRRAPTPIERGT